MLRRSGWRMSKLLGICVAISVLNLDLVVAQQPRNRFGAGQRDRPVVSPFLSMVDNGDGSGGNELNYFNIVRPIQRGREANRRIQNEFRQVEASIANNQRNSNRPSQNSNALNSTPITTGRMPQTGHVATFNDLGGRFNSGVAGDGVNNFGRNGRN